MADITLSDLEQTVGAGTVLRYFDDDNDGVVDAATVATYLDRATARARGALTANFTPAHIELIKLDADYKACVCEIALMLACRRKPEWQREDGTFPYAKVGSDALTHLVNVGKGIAALATEATAGRNPVHTASTHPAEVPTVFAATRTRPYGPGGF